jgi:hypothetical protein
MEMGVMAERYILVMSCWDGVQLRKLFWWHHAAVARSPPGAFSFPLTINIWRKNRKCNNIL